ncbi:MAG: hypothetical protein U0931_23385 [Vulcanimicrobiota bacterium]
MKKLILMGALLAFGCGSKNGFAAFVVNQDAQSAGSKPGKSYSAEPCSFEMTDKIFTVESGQSGSPSHLRLVVGYSGDMNKDLSKTLNGREGEVQLEAQKYELEKITVTVQTLEGEVARGNFNARIKGQNPPWEVVGSFDAKIKL